MFRPTIGLSAGLLGLVIAASPASAMPLPAQPSLTPPDVVPVARRCTSVGIAPGLGAMRGIPGVCKGTPRRSPGCKTVRYTDAKGVTRYGPVCK